MTKKLKSPEELKSLQEKIRGGRDPEKPCITICAGTGCLAYGTQNLVDRFKAEVEQQNLKDKVDIRTTGCHGFCERGPLVVIHPKKILYQQVKVDDAPEIIREGAGDVSLFR